MKYFSKSEFYNDPRMIECRLKHGMVAFGIYTRIKELMYEQESANLPLKFDVLAAEMRVDEDIVKSVILDFKLFRIVESTNEFFSFEVSQEISRKNQLREKRSHCANIRWNGYREKHHQPPTPPPVTQVRTPEAVPVAEPKLPPEKTIVPGTKETPITAPPPPKLTPEQAKEIVGNTFKPQIEKPMTETEKAEYDEILSYNYFVRHIKDANAETMRFWNFYQRVGWKDNRDREIKDKFAAAQLWNTGDAPKFSEKSTAFISMLKKIYQTERNTISLIDFIYGIHNVSVTEEKVILYCTEQMKEMIETNIELIKMDLKVFYKKKTLEYRVATIAT